MEQAIWRQLEFVRAQTLKLARTLPEEKVRVIPEGFRNHMLWNLGHLALVMDKYAFSFTGRIPELPAIYQELFANGTTPLEWTSESPSLKDILAVLEAQPERVRTVLSGRLDDPIEPYSTSSGYRIETVGQLINFTTYHEGMHFSIIKLYNKLIQGS
ncbi:DinB family protein [Paenibacillus phocaensis]|uniref:DinB family protein n=1 Tax=Paenibacillus phocaensis TaxID=1776378 RepID=UPI000839C29E|nr:DinB family protein [Paenibacillus phocaensis]